MASATTDVALTRAGESGTAIRSASSWVWTWAPAAPASLPVTTAWTRWRASSQFRAEARPTAAGAVRPVPARALLWSQAEPASVMRTARQASASAVTVTTRYPSPATVAASTQLSPRSRAASPDATARGPPGPPVWPPTRRNAIVVAYVRGPRAVPARAGRHVPAEVTVVARARSRSPVITRGSVAAAEQGPGLPARMWAKRLRQRPLTAARGVPASWPGQDRRVLPGRQRLAGR